VWFVRSGAHEVQEDVRALSEELFCARGLGILLVVLVHVLGVDSLHGVRKLFTPERADLQWVAELVHSFNMATMLIGSGVAMSAFGRPDGSLFLFVRKKWDKLIVPMLVWAPVLLVVQECSRGVLQEQRGWLAPFHLLASAWFPPYSIFWFVHVLVGCSVLAWLFRRWAMPVLGHWSGLVYVVLAILLHLAVSTWAERFGNGPDGYVELILYWNRFFGLGLLIHPWLVSVRRVLSRLPLVLQLLVPCGFLALLVLVYAALPAERYAAVCLINGPLGFWMLLSLSIVLRNQAKVGDGIWRGAWSELVSAGSISMALYLFHLYFVSGTRIVLERWHPGTPVMEHLVLGLLAGCVGPWLLVLVLRGLRLFRWSVGLSGRGQGLGVGVRQVPGAL
jgi:fucose 4-O-acetylase-like acetyltransferase